MKLISYHKTRNLGDAIQTLASQYLWKKYNIDKFEYVDRSKLVNNMFINGWHRNKTEKLPESAIFASIHTDIQHLAHISKNNLVGCRDNWTLNNCKQLNIDCVPTGCVSINIPLSNCERNGKTVHIDSAYSEEKQFTQIISSLMSWEDQLSVAEKRLDLISKASLVHTTRLHILLSCIAMGTPVILDKIPKYQPERFDLYENVFSSKVIELNSGVRENLLNLWNKNFDKVLNHYKNFIQ